MKKFVILTLIFTSFFIHINSQIKHDIIYLKNGSIIKGNLSYDTITQVKINTLKGITYAYNKDEVMKIKHKYHRYINYTSTGILVGSALNEKPVLLSILSEHNYQFLDYFAFGGVFGVELINETTLPLAANLKIYLPLQSSTLFLSGTAGYSFSVEKPRNIYNLSKAYGGSLASILLGIIIPLNYNNGIYFSIGYRYNELEYKYDYWNNLGVHRTYYYNRLSMRFGIVLY